MPPTIKTYRLTVANGVVHSIDEEGPAAAAAALAASASRSEAKAGAASTAPLPPVCVLCSKPAGTCKCFGMAQRQEMLLAAVSETSGFGFATQSASEVSPDPEAKAVAASSSVLLSLLRKLCSYRYALSYNDSYFGEPEGELKRLVADIDRRLPMKSEEGEWGVTGFGFATQSDAPKAIAEMPAQLQGVDLLLPMVRDFADEGRIITDYPCIRVLAITSMPPDSRLTVVRALRGFASWALARYEETLDLRLRLAKAEKERDALAAKLKAVQESLQ